MSLDFPTIGLRMLAEMSKELGFTFPFLFDESQDVARAFDAQCTPDFFIHDAGGRLVYRGQLDDSRPGNEIPVTGRDLRAALDAVIDGRADLFGTATQHRLQYQVEMTERSTVRLVQLRQGSMRRVARVEEPSLRLLSEVDSIVDLASAAISQRQSLTSLVDRYRSRELLDYDAVYSGASSWRLIAPIDHPEPARCLVSGTGLTHLGSAESRNAMHGKSDDALTDSMRMFRSGLEGGRPPAGRCGTAPEWFYKGNGTVLRTTAEELTVPAHADDGGEEAEVAGIYVIGSGGAPYRIGMTAGNEFSDHKFERTNYLNLAGSKLRACAIGPELVLDHAFDFVAGHVRIERDGRVLWEREIATGEREMCHSLANIEHHHFKFDSHRIPGDVHVHFYGAPALSFSDQIQLCDGDVIIIRFTGFGRPLRNVVRVADPSGRADDRAIARVTHENLPVCLRGASPRRVASTIPAFSTSHRRALAASARCSKLLIP